MSTINNKSRSLRELRKGLSSSFSGLSLKTWKKEGKLIDNKDNAGEISQKDLSMSLHSFMAPRDMYSDLDISGKSSLPFHLTDLPFYTDSEDLTSQERETTSETKSSPGSVGLVALIAHNNMKLILADFVEKHIAFFRTCNIVTTASTGAILEERNISINIVRKVASGPLGGDQEVGALVAQGRINAVFFFKDPLSSHQHAADIEALLRIQDVNYVPYATNPGTGLALVCAMMVLGTDFARKSGESEVVKKYKSEQATLVRRSSVRW